MFKNVSHGNIVFFHWKNEDNWPVEFVSDNIQYILGYTAQDFITGKIKYSDLIHPDDLNQVDDEVTKAIEDNIEEFTHKFYRLKNKNGNYHTIYDHTKIVRDIDGNITHFQGYIYDQTACLDINKNLTAQKQRLLLVLEGTGHGIWDWNPQTNEVVFDEGWAKMLGYGLYEIENNLETWQSRVHPEDIEGCFKDIQAHINGETEYYSNIHRMKHKKGHWIYIWDRGKVVERDNNGTPIRFTGTHTDVTAQKETELALVEAMQARENFFALMSHEIRTPMNGVLGFTEELLRDKTLNKQQREQVEYINSSSSGLLEIINDILDYAKLSSGQLTLEDRPFSLKNKLAELEKATKFVVEKNGNQLKWSLADDIADYIISDENRINQILTNLISNAAKFTTNGEIKINVQKCQTDNEQSLKFTISDNGIGIPKDKLEDLFRPFIQAEDSTSRKYGGTGLGLTISKNLVTALGGEIWVESELKKGTTFYFTISYFPDLGTFEGKESSEDDLINLSLKGVEVLVAEDNQINRKLISSYLSKEEMGISFAHDGQEAVKMMNENQYDIVLMDVQMPKMSGIEATKKICEQLQDKCPPIIALSANAFNEDKAKCFDAGMLAFISKPVNKERLINTIKKVLLDKEILKLKKSQTRPFG
jgi:PAS domain S-box-containing protein